jgi:hypothetical protein
MITEYIQKMQDASKVFKEKLVRPSRAMRHVEHKIRVSRKQKIDEILR